MDNNSPNWQKINQSWYSRYPNRETSLQKQNVHSTYLIKEEIEKRKNKIKNFDIQSLELMNSKWNLFFENKIQNISSFPIKFDDVCINEQIRTNLRTLGFTEMTPIQRISISLLWSLSTNNDLIGTAQTGSGKTISYLIPTATYLLSQDIERIQFTNYVNKSYPVMLIILPTRELAQQTYNEALKWFHNTPWIISIVYGGVSFPDQINDLKSGCDILIATPGRLKDFLQRGWISFDDLQFLVIDEADELLDMGFEKDITHIIKDYGMPPVSQRQTLWLSATFPKRWLHLLSTDLVIKLEDHFYITSNSWSLFDNRDYGNKVTDNDPNANIDQRLYYIEKNSFDSKVLVLHNILQMLDGKVLIFVNRKCDADIWSDFWFDNKYNVTSIHGDKSQYERNQIISDFSNGYIPILIATDFASRGLDIPMVKYVINFDMPNNINNYIHRIGRTGRCGIKGRAISWWVSSDRALFNGLVTILQKGNQKIPEFLMYNY